MGEPNRVLSVVTRLNIGGPAHHVTLLDAGLQRDGYETLLVYGSLGRGEGSLENLASRVPRLKVRALVPEVAPIRDALAFFRLWMIIRKFQPHIVHTHTAKAGLLGRLAALMARGARPVILHTFHGHVLTGYFGRAQSSLLARLERAIGKRSDLLIGVSSAVVSDLIRLGVASDEQFVVIPYGLDLKSFEQVQREDGAAIRDEIGLRPEAVLFTFVGRLVPIKRVDVLLDGFASAASRNSVVHLAIVGDGDLRTELEERANALGISHRVSFLGFRKDLPQIAAATDVAVLTSDNEGTPLALIEAAAAARCSIATRVGGVGDIVNDQTGRIVPPRDPGAVAAAMLDLATNRELRRRLGKHAQTHVLTAYAVERLIHDVDRLYRRLVPLPSQPEDSRPDLHRNHSKDQPGMQGKPV